jgi:hypothetical protein
MQAYDVKRKRIVNAENEENGVIGKARGQND